MAWTPCVVACGNVSESSGVWGVMGLPVAPDDWESRTAVNALICVAPWYPTPTYAVQQRGGGGRGRRGLMR